MFFHQSLAFIIASEVLHPVSCDASIFSHSDFYGTFRNLKNHIYPTKIIVTLPVTNSIL